ncbi:unnamed protein product, partial [Prorocentrum cordatum]
RQRRRQEEGEDHARGRMARTTRKRASKRRGHLGNLFLCRSARHAEAVHWVCRQGTAQAEATTYHTTRYDNGWQVRTAGRETTDSSGPDAKS